MMNLYNGNPQPMANAKITAWKTELAANTTLFQQAFGGLSAEQLNWKPNPETWSIAQNINHLITINETYFPVIEKVQNGEYNTPWWSKLAFVTRFFGNVIYNASDANRKRKMKTFPIWEPEASDLPADILDQFEAHQQALAKQIESAVNLIERGVVISSPANSSIVYKLERAFDIIVVHEKRHFEQAKEVMKMMQSLA